MMEWQCPQLDHMQIICTSFLTDNHTNTASFHYYSLEPNRQYQSIEGNYTNIIILPHDTIPKENLLWKYFHRLKDLHIT